MNALANMEIYAKRCCSTKLTLFVDIYPFIKYVTRNEVMVAHADLSIVTPDLSFIRLTQL